MDPDVSVVLIDREQKDVVLSLECFVPQCLLKVKVKTV